MGQNRRIKEIRTLTDLQELQTPINFEALREGVTPSEIQTYHDCHEKWYRSYNQLLRLRRPKPWAFTYGSAFHAHQEEWFSSKGKRAMWNLNKPIDPMAPQDWHEEGNKWDAVGEAQTEAYRIHYKRDFDRFDILSIEQKIDLEYDGHKLRGMMDIFAYEKSSKEYLVWDFKTSGRLDSSVADTFRMRFQFRYYDFCGRLMYPKKKIIGFMPDVIKKPQIKQCQNETLIGYAGRVKRDMITRPEAYFWREIVEVTPDSLALFEHTFLRPALDAFRNIRKAAKNDDQSILRSLARQKNSAACCKYGEKYICEFYSLCHEGEHTIDRYQRKPTKHSELDEDID